MRLKTKEMILKAIERVLTSYHLYREGRRSDTNYAHQGFKKNLYYTSDRTKALDSNFNIVDSEGRITGEILKGFGLEIEIECWSINNGDILTDIVEHRTMEYFDENLFKFQEDGSLTGGLSAIECITQVMTKEAIRNMYPAFKYMFTYFEHLNISAARSGNCGMHINMSNGLFGKDKKTQVEAIRKLIYIVNKHYDIMCVMFKRNATRTTYCKKMDSFLDKNYAKNFDLERYGVESNSNHYICFNYAHFNAGRVELRIVGGQKDYYTFRNTMETMFHLVDIVKTISWDKIDDITEVFKGCNQYVIKRLDDVKRAGYISDDIYNKIVSISDTETDFGRNL